MAHHNINKGHSVNARGMSSQWLDEVTEDRKVGDAAIKYLRAGGAQVSDSTSSEANSSADLAFIVKSANASGADYFTSIHFNASKRHDARGVEVWYYTGNAWGKAMAERMASALASLMGIPNRGAKPTTGLYVIRKTNMPAVLIETCFGDNEADVAAYRKVGPDAVGKCIAECLLGKTVAQTTQQSTQQATQGAPTTSTQASGLAVDGSFGPATVRALQKALGTTVDGVVSNQPAGNAKYVPSAVSGTWRWMQSGYRAGSSMVRALQAKLGVTADGWWGKATATAYQRKLGVSTDGSFGPASCRAMQAALNKGKLW